MVLSKLLTQTAPEKHLNYSTVHIYCILFCNCIDASSIATDMIWGVVTIIPRRISLHLEQAQKARSEDVFVGVTHIPVAHKKSFCYKFLIMESIRRIYWIYD